MTCTRVRLEGSRTGGYLVIAASVDDTFRANGKAIDPLAIVSVAHRCHLYIENRWRSGMLEPSAPMQSLSNWSFQAGRANTAHMKSPVPKLLARTRIKSGQKEEKGHKVWYMQVKTCTACPTVLPSPHVEEEI